jgi:hypothetical protein
MAYRSRLLDLYSQIRCILLVFILSALSWICSSTEVVEAVGNCISKAGESVNQSIQLVLCIRHVPSLILAGHGGEGVERGSFALVSAGSCW